MGALQNTKYTVSNGIYIPEFYANFKVITSGPYSVQQDDYILLVDTNGGPIEILLSTNDPFISGKILYIKDIGGYAGINPITITEANIDGNNPTNIDVGYKGIQIIYYNNLEWYRLSNTSK